MNLLLIFFINLIKVWTKIIFILISNFFSSFKSLNFSKIKSAFIDIVLIFNKTSVNNSLIESAINILTSLSFPFFSNILYINILLEIFSFSNK